MAEQSEWEAAYRDVIAKGREGLGDPPTPDKLVAYSRRALSESEAEQVRESLAYYPDLAAALAEDAEPASDATPYLSEAQLAADWQTLRRRLKGRPAAAVTTVPPARETLRLWQWANAASFLLAVVFAGFYVKSQNDLQRPHANVERFDLFDDSSRGASGSVRAIRPQPSTNHLLLTLTLAANAPTDNFRVELVDVGTAPPRVIWTSPIRRGPDGTFVVEVPRASLPRGARLSLYEGDQREPIATYSLRLADE